MHEEDEAALWDAESSDVEAHPLTVFSRDPCLAFLRHDIGSGIQRSLHTIMVRQENCEDPDTANLAEEFLGDLPRPVFDITQEAKLLSLMNLSSCSPTTLRRKGRLWASAVYHSSRFWVNCMMEWLLESVRLGRAVMLATYRHFMSDESTMVVVSCWSDGVQRASILADGHCFSSFFSDCLYS